MPNQAKRSAGKFSQMWPLVAIGLGFGTTIAWMALLGWLALRLVELIV